MTDVPKQIDWHLVVNAALCRMQGLTQEETAQRVGRTARTIRNWESEEWWSDAVAEARDTWLGDVIREARAALYLQLKKARDPIRAMQVLERMDPAFKPPAQQLEHSGPGGGPIEHDHTPNLENLSVEELETLEQLQRRAGVTSNGGPANGSAP